MDQNEMMLEYLMEMGALQPQQDALAQKRALVQQLRQGGQMPGMTTTAGVGGGGVYEQPKIQRAASPLEMLGSVAQTGLGEYQNQQADQMQQQYGADRRMGLENLRTRMNAARQRGGAPKVMDTADYGGGI